MAPFAVIVIFLMGLVLMQMVAPIHAIAPKIVAPVIESGTPKMDTSDLEKLGTGSVVAVGLGLCLFGGAAACFLALVAWIIVPGARLWLNNLIHHKAVRPLPALRFMDLLATAAVYISVPTFILGAVSFYTGPRAKFPLSEQLLVDIAGKTAGILIAVKLARHRAGGRHGSNGLWPFWTLPEGTPPRSIWFDVGVGVLAYPISLWVVLSFGLLNKFLHEHLHGVPDTNRIISELMQQQSLSTMVILMISATAGAAFFEELFFRGMMYNVFYRYLGGALSAVMAAMIFAGVHFVYSQILPLLALAMILTWLYDWTGRLVSSMTLHAVNNLMALMLSLMIRDALSAQG